MRFFLCPFGDFELGIPAEAAESLLVYNAGTDTAVTDRAGGEDERAVVHNEETGDVYFFLPRYFGLSGQEVHHGIVLKEPDRIDDGRNRKIFLVTTVEKIDDVPSGDIQKLPGILKGMEGSSFFTGIRFQGTAMTLFADPMRLMLHTLDGDVITTLEEADEEECISS
jgi:hypothetical protein